MLRFLVVEDDDLYAGSLVLNLEARGYVAERVQLLRKARDVLRARRFDVVLLDSMLPDGCGPDLILELRALPDPPCVICLTAHAGIETAVEAMRAGAIDYILKTESPDAVLARIERHLPRRPIHLSEEPAVDLDDELVGSTPAMQAVRRLAQLAARTSTTVLISGETGSGKNHLARLIHRCSARAARPFVTVDCAALSETLAESELFGHERGAFTGAVQRHVGAIEAAAAGTLFFDELADLPATVQGKLLRVLDERVIRRVGGARDIPVEARIVGATRRSLVDLVQLGSFREDLYFRLSVLEIQLPPLRERVDDIPLLFDRLLERSGHADLSHGINGGLRAALLSHPFFGNVRELRNLAERMVLLTRHGELPPGAAELGLHGASALAVPRALAGARPPLERVGRETEIGLALVAAGGRIGDAARSLGISRHALRRRLKKLQGEDGDGLEPE